MNDKDIKSCIRLVLQQFLHVLRAFFLIVKHTHKPTCALALMHSVNFHHHYHHRIISAPSSSSSIGRVHEHTTNYYQYGQCNFRFNKASSKEGRAERKRIIASRACHCTSLITSFHVSLFVQEKSTKKADAVRWRSDCIILRMAKQSGIWIKTKAKAVIAAKAQLKDVSFRSFRF